jgi:ABC-type branched-subunit amino acid transport system substrate-binding protein
MIKLNQLLFIVLFVNLVVIFPASGKTSPLNTLIVYKDTPTGNRFREAIQDTIEANPDTVGSAIKIIEAYAYKENEAGINRILSASKNGKVDLILGPTESDLFVSLANKRTELNKNGIPVVSSQITVKPPNINSNWLFRTNVAAIDRANKLANYINKFCTSSVITIYADTEFGRTSEYALQNALMAINAERFIPLKYQAYSFRSTQSIEEQVRKIHNNKPEIVAIFAEREDLPLISRKFKEVSYTNYNPLFVTNLDASTLLYTNRSSTETFKNLIFLSLSDNVPEKNKDDVVVQAKAMTLLLAQLIKNVNEEHGFPKRNKVRKLLASELRAVLSGDVAIEPLIHGLRFRNNENTHPLSIYSLTTEKINKLDDIQTLGIDQQIIWKYNLIISRYGFWPIFNIILILTLTFLVNWRDVRDWHKGSVIALISAYPFWLLYLFNGFLTIGLYIVLSESGAISYGNPVTAFIVALTPTALINTTFFNTKAGKAIGLKEYYEQFLRFLHRKIMYKRYQADENIINILAYSNPASRLKKTLSDLYENARTDTKLLMDAKIKKIDEEATGWRDKRRRLSRLVYAELDWYDLVHKGLIPEETGVSENFRSNINLPDPESLITHASRKITHNETLKKKLFDYIKSDLGKIAFQKRKQEIQDMLDEVDKNAISEQDYIEHSLRVLFVLRGYSANEIKQEWLNDDH